MKVAIDSNALTYLIEVTDPAYDPQFDESGLRDDRISMLRVFLYCGYTYFVLPTVSEEFYKIKNVLKKRAHESFCQVLTEQGNWNFDRQNLKKRVQELEKSHNQKSDCQIVAEAEMADIEVLLTKDRDLILHLEKQTRVSLQLPQQFWISLNVSRGCNPMLTPDPTNPLADKKWWIWRA
jgi:predicted nucleic acid-binding protein